VEAPSDGPASKELYNMIWISNKQQRQPVSEAQNAYRRRLPVQLKSQSTQLYKGKKTTN